MFTLHQTKLVWGDELPKTTKNAKKAKLFHDDDDTDIHRIMTIKVIKTHRKTYKKLKSAFAKPKDFGQGIPIGPPTGPLGGFNQERKVMTDDTDSIQF
jgi:hypothetical protein